MIVVVFVHHYFAHTNISPTSLSEDFFSFVHQYFCVLPTNISPTSLSEDFFSFVQSSSTAVKLVRAE